MVVSDIRAPQAPALPGRPWAFAAFFYKKYALALSAMLVFETGQAACQILLPYAVKRILDSGVDLAGSVEANLKILEPSLILFVLLNVGVLLFSRASGTVLVMLGPALRRRVRQNLYHFLQYHSQRFFIGNFAGSLSNRISEVAMGVTATMWTILFDFWPIVVTFSVSLFLMHQAHSGLAALLAAWILIYVGVSFLLALRCQVLAKKYAAARSTVSGKIVDSVTNVMNSKLFSRLGFEREYLTDYLNMEVRAARKTFWYMEGMRWFQFVATMGLQVAIILLAIRYWLAGDLSTGSFAMVTSLALLIINDARGLSRRFLEFFEYIGNIADGVGMIVRPHEVIDKPGAKSINVRRGEIVFENVVFKYADGLQVFDDLNVRIRHGERIGLVGFSGSGKTTFVNLILRMYDLNAGRILLDDNDVTHFTQDSLRAQVSLIPQDPMLFHRSLMENIRYGRPESTDDEVVAAAKAARAHEFIGRLPDGYEALVGERGVKLSGGQRQRIAIARAVLKNAPILILDEATSSLDSITERQIQEALQELMKDRTVVVVAHRLSTISRLDRILVFDKGRIVEDGSHAELLRQGGHYAKLWGMQAGGFLPDQEMSEGH